MRAGIPAGVINVLCGKTEAIGQTLTGSTKVRKLTFTGSTRVGKMLAADCAGTMKRTTMELGGNAPFIVFADADLDAAVAGAVASKYRNAGQTCVCANRILVEDAIYDTFAERLASSAQAFKLGDGHDEAVTMGPLIHQGAAAKVVNLVNDALAQGALVRHGCGTSDLGSGYVEPGVLIDVTPQMRIAQEEIFGPVAPLAAFPYGSASHTAGQRDPSGFGGVLFIPVMRRAWCGWPKHWNTVLSASMKASCRMKWRRSAGLKNQVMVARGPVMGWMITWKLNISVLGV
jgi:succinate-semialdehyde dehydrogenase/glutarate-semialdehyde dehydrogenase